MPRVFFEDSSLCLIQGDARNALSLVEDESVNCIVTSPPYFGLRDYGVEGQIGLEETVEDYVDTLVDVFSAARQVLQKDGTLWLVIGDSYASKPRGSDNGWDKCRLTNPGGTQKAQRASLRKTGERHRGKRSGLKNKDMIGVPWRVAFALQADGWLLRNATIWHKPNAMPSSAKDRLTCSYEFVFLLAKSERYFFDARAIAEDAVSEHPSGNGYKRPEQIARGGRGNSEPWVPTEKRHPRDVWSITTKPYKDAHFATFPRDLVEKCVLAGSPAGGVVLDPFFGSGTTALAAGGAGRRTIGIELSPDYCELAIRRVTNQPERVS